MNTNGHRDATKPSGERAYTKNAKDLIPMTKIKINLFLEPAKSKIQDQIVKANVGGFDNQKIKYLFSLSRCDPSRMNAYR